MPENTDTCANQEMRSTHDDVCHDLANEEYSTGDISPGLSQQALYKIYGDDSKPTDAYLNLRVQSQQDQDQISQLIPISKSDIRKLACSLNRSNENRIPCKDRISSNNFSLPASPWIKLFTSLFLISVLGLALFITVKAIQYF